MKFLPAPWRWPYIAGIKISKGCIFCQALKLSDKEGLVCFRGQRFFVMLNKFPYSSGHVMIAPMDHVASPLAIAPHETVELWSLQQRVLQALSTLYAPDGFNIGMNIGQAAGAGVKDHFHLHIVPRWSGDANFMAVIGDTKVQSFDMLAVWSELHGALNSSSAT